MAVCDKGMAEEKEYRKDSFMEHVDNPLTPYKLWFTPHRTSPHSESGEAEIM